MNYPQYNPDWRQDLAEYRQDRRFDEALKELTAGLKRPTLLVLIGLPGSGKSSISAAVREKFGFMALDSISILKWLEEKEQAREKWIYPSAYVAYFYKEELAKHWLKKGVSVVDDCLAAKPGIYDQLEKKAKDEQADFRTVVLQSDDVQRLMKRKILAKDLATKLGDWPTFKQDISERPDSDAAVFAANNPDWAEKSYGDFTAGRWERWQKDFLAYPVADDPKTVLRLDIDQLSLDEVVAKVVAWLKAV